MGRKAVVRQDVSCPSCGSHHVVKCGRPLGRQRYLCRDCGKYFLGDATYHHHSRKLREEALKMYANGMSMRAISRVLNVPLGTVFTWIKRYGRQRYKELAEGRTIAKVVDEMFTYYLFRNTRVFYKWIFHLFHLHYSRSLLSFFRGDRDASAFDEIKCYVPEGGRLG
ncbi:IS1 family transposase [Sulfolobus islandicus HVE10/4]|uniref:IS1 family transposase n=1 Tax=Saccharolobus islandicus (strain HVE10/4) TaxID=930943 RepID=F0NJG1_SACI0|nr:IS1 family transposase [Sulfolobus islandicus HVE10/4]